MHRIFVASLFALFILTSCKKQTSCDPQDSKKVCEAFQQCLRSDTSAEVCRMGEQDANKIEKGSQH